MCDSVFACVLELWELHTYDVLSVSEHKSMYSSIVIMCILYMCSVCVCVWVSDCMCTVHVHVHVCVSECAYSSVLLFCVCPCDKVTGHSNSCVVALSTWMAIY